MTGGPRVAIVGAGMSGLCVAHRLRREGVGDIVLYEKAAEVGGTWRENTYPGLSCDVPSRLYSYSFAPNPDWSRHFAPGGEIQDYLRGLAGAWGLRPLIRFGSEVTEATWDGTRWQLRTRDGRRDSADVLVSATGVLHHPRVPDIPGLETFAGAAFHSARWDHDVALDGRRIAVIGTGSTGVQIVCALAGRAERLLVFQRTPQWILPVRNARYARPTRALYRRVPALARLSHRAYQAVYELILGNAVVRPGWQRTLVDTLCRLNLRLGVRDPELRRRLTPGYQPMCKRLVMSADFYPAMQKPAVGLVTDAIERVEPRGIVTADGHLHELDVIVLATGFDAHAYLRPMQVTGEGGVTLEQAWSEGPRAYRTVALPGFPNLFTMMGPHSPIGNHSLVAIAETQAAYIAHWVRELRSGRVAAAAPTAEATATFNADMRAAMPRTVWASGCRSWYLGQDGVPELWPWRPSDHRALLREPEYEHFELRRAA
jgi:cation diffusion facilitator CzcD-associated flavoprotein CzcO